MGIKEKIETIVREIYGGAGVEYSPEAEKKIELYTRQGFDKLPICMAKTHLSLSHDPNLKGAPTGFIVPVRDVRASVRGGVPVPAARNHEHDARVVDQARVLQGSTWM